MATLRTGSREAKKSKTPNMRNSPPISLTMKSRSVETSDSGGRTSTRSMSGLSLKIKSRLPTRVRSAKTRSAIRKAR
ncbi:MAG: hypothetical protein DMG24_18490 [Acidobacteria bacterium]|nr:MAG: hypothetical protein DMG24_18490 [Acidobacteriota bacterium]